MQISDVFWAVAAATVLVGFGLGAGYLIRYLVANIRAETAEKKAGLMLERAKAESEDIIKDSKLKAKEEVIRAREEFERSVENKRREMATMEEHLAQREMNLERKLTMIDKKEGTIDEKLQAIEKREQDLAGQSAKLDTAIAEERTRLQRVAGMSQEEARSLLISRVEKDIQGEVGALIKKSQEQAREDAEKTAMEIVVLAIQKCSTSHANDVMTSTVNLPGEDMKGRIIGREGRNIRTLEAVTGVNILIDDTPEAVVISGFDPIKREIARQSLKELIADGRIHPARIEEVVAKVTENMDKTLRSAGEEGAYRAGVQEVSPKLQLLLGRLKFRTSYSQNVLQHSIEVAQLMGLMAGELGLDVSLARRIGLFHDIGKAMDHDIEGGHAVIGADFLKRQGESQVVVNAVAAHHQEVEKESVYANLACAADAISSARPGARSETTGIYIKRLESLEEIARGFAGVHKCYAIQAGREVRVMVEPDSVDDNQALVLAREISRKIESDLEYPGEIRVVVIREKRCVEYAR